MGRILDYPEKPSPGLNDYLLVDSSSEGTKKISASNIVTVDSTLTQPGQPADAKKTGDEIASIKTDLDNIPTVDSTLTQSGQAADAKATGDAVGELQNDLNGFKNVIKDMIVVSDNYESGQIDGIYISPSTIKWLRNVAYGCGLYPVPSTAYEVTITANQDYNGLIAFLTSDAHENFTAPTFADGETGLRTTTSGSTSVYKIPSGCTYIYVYLYNASGSNDRRPDALQINYFVKAPKIDPTLKISGQAADAAVVGNLLDGIFVDNIFSGTLLAGGINATDGTEYSSSAYVRTGYVDVSSMDGIVYTRIFHTSASASYATVAFYDAEKVFISSQKPILNSPKHGYIYQSIDIPENAKYARFTWQESVGTFQLYDRAQYDNAITTRIDKLSESIVPVDNTVWLAGLVGLAQRTNGVFNTVARMRMLCDTEWTPLKPVPKQYKINGTLYYGEFEPQEKQKGIPYASQLQYELWIGKCISFETFLSALKNPNSVIYDFSRQGTGHRHGAWYSLNCSKAVGWALNLRNTYATGAFEADPNINKVADFGNYTANDIRIGDILQKPSVHTAMVTDLVYNTMGTLSQIEVSEAVTPTCRRKKWNIYGELENFFDVFDGYGLYRYDLIDSVPPVNMESMFPYVSTTLGLDFGNKSNYLLNEEPVKITFLDRVSDTLKIKKDGNVSTIDVSAYEDLSEYEYTPQTAGYYEVYLDGDTDDNHVGFCVNDNAATYSAGVLTFSSSTATLNMVSYSKDSGRTHITDQFPTAEDLANGYMTLTVPSSVDYIHAIFANDYGKRIIEIAVA